MNVKLEDWSEFWSNLEGVFCISVIYLFIIIINSIVLDFQEAHKLLQPADETLKAMAIEFAEYQVNFK